jgi:hypothetical protein
MASADGTIVIEDARIMYRNFAGKKGMFNDEGKRNFAVVLPDDVAAQLEADGWNVKRTKPREEGDIPIPFLSVAVSFENRPPRITMIANGVRTHITEDLVDLLDAVDILNVDLVVRPYKWEVQGNGGIKAYLKTLFVTIEEDELERKYGAKEQSDV